jgi:hypothetical protein
MHWNRLVSVAFLGSAFCLTATSDAVAQKRQRDVITEQELKPSGDKAQDLYQAIRALRPHFLQPPRGNRSMGSYAREPTVVYVDGLRTGDPETLKMLSSRDVIEVRYLEPSKAQEEFGMSHSAGAILVKTIKSRPAARPDSGPPGPEHLML